MLPGKTYTPDDYARMAWRRRWYIAIPAVVIASSTMVVSMFLQDRYRATTSIRIVPQQVPENYVRPTVEENVGERLNAMSQQILSRTRLERIVQESKLYERERKTMILEDVIAKMRSDISLNIPRPRSRRDEVTTFSVSFTTTDPGTAKRVTDQLASLFVRENLEDRSARAKGTDLFLQAQLEASKRRLLEQEGKLQEFRTKHPGNVPEQADSYLQLLQAAQSRQQMLRESNNRDIDRLALLEKTLAELPPVSAAAAVAPAPRRSGNDPNGPVTAAQQLENARSQLRALELRLKPEHPDIARAKRLVTELEAAADAEALEQPLSAGTPAQASNPATDRQTMVRADNIRTEMNEIRVRIEAERRESARLQESVAAYSGRLQVTPALQSELTELMRDYQTLREGYNALLRKSEESKIAVELETRQIGERFQIIDQARQPERPISPNRVRINMFGILGGLALGLGLVAFLEYRDTSFKSDDDVMTTLALPVLAVIPIMTNAGERRQARRRKLLLAASASVTCMLLAAAVMVVWQYRDKIFN